MLQCLLFWVKRVPGTRPEALWEFSFKFIKQVSGILKITLSLLYNLLLLNILYFSGQQGHRRNGCTKSLLTPRQYKDVHTNPDSDCYVLQVTTLNFIFIPVVMGMTLTLVSTSWFWVSVSYHFIAQWALNVSDTADFCIDLIPSIMTQIS